MSNISNRKIIHIDMDAFYASVEQRDHPELRGKAIAVGGGEKRGVTTTASYEARKFGVKSAMPGWKAIELCPHLIFVPPRFEAYREVSRQIRCIFNRYTDLVEPLSLDEAYLDVTSNKKQLQYATDIALEIKAAIKEETQLSASAGVSYNKFLAKMASDVNKPDGITVIKPHQAATFLANLPIERFYGVGKVTAAKMKALGIHFGSDLLSWQKIELAKHFGKIGLWYYDIVRGIDDRKVSPSRQRKSIAVERTLDTNLDGVRAVTDFALELCPKLMRAIDKHQFYGRTFTLKLKNKDFEIKSRSRSIAHSYIQLEQLIDTTKELTSENPDLCHDIRLVGICVSNPISELGSAQLTLF